MPDTKIRVLQVIDKLSMDGINPSSCAKLFVDWIPRFDPDLFEVKVCTLRNPDPAGKVLESIGVPVFYLDKGRISPGNIGAIEAVIKEENVDIVHLHGYSSANFGRIAARRQGMKNVVHEHAILRVLPYQYIADWILRSYTDVAVAVCGPVKDFMIKGRHIPEQKIHVIENGLCVEGFREPPDGVISQMKQAYNIPSDKRIVGTLTRFREEKGNRYLIEAMPAILAEHPDVVCVLFGDGPERQELQELARSLKIEREVVFPGFVSESRYAYHIFDLIVIPSLSEGFPLVLVEAMAAGRPVVATEVGGIVDILADGESGLLVPPKDSSAIAQRVTGVLRDVERQREMGEAGRVRSEKYDIKRNVESLEALYHSLVNS